MLKLEARPQPSQVWSYGSPILALLITVLIGVAMFVALGKDPLEITRLNLLPADCFPYLAPAGSLYDSGNFQRCIEEGVDQGNLDALKTRRTEVRARGGIYGIGYATAVEPSQSNMGYMAILKTEKERQRSGPKDGAVSYVTVSVDSSGAVNVVSESVPQGQGHATVLAQIVSDQLGLKPTDITVNLEMDTEKDAWSIAARSPKCCKDLADNA